MRETNGNGMVIATAVPKGHDGRRRAFSFVALAKGLSEEPVDREGISSLRIRQLVDPLLCPSS